jgi:hypothetical protein
MSNRANSSLPKSTPDPKVIYSRSLSQVGSNSADSNVSPILTDLTSFDYHEGLLRWELFVTCGTGGTPTAPGASKNFTWNHAFVSSPVDVLADAPTILTTSKTSLVCALPNAVAAQATGTLTFTGLPSDGQTVTIGSMVYTFRTTLTSAPYEVYIGINAGACANHLVDAINAESSTAGVAWSSGRSHPDVTASNVAGVITVTANLYGTYGNSIATTETCSNASWGDVTLTTGTAAGLRIYASDAFLHGGRYLYSWYDIDALADANSHLDAAIRLVRI